MSESAPWTLAKQALSETLFAGVVSWRSLAFDRASRHLFVPDKALRSYWDTPDLEPIDRAADPEKWYRAVYSDDAIVTQQGTDRRSTSSCSQPSIVFAMLEILEPQPGDSVLEIGTGTGWNAGLLACQLGADRVVSMEMAPDVAEQARVHLRQAGLPVCVITGDGMLGAPADAPFDRVICTASVHFVPRAWLEQTRPGGVIVTPWRTDFDSGAVLKLVVAGDGASATGRFGIGSSFMPLLGERRGPPGAVPDGFAEQAAQSLAAVDVGEVFGEAAAFAIGLLVPGSIYWFEHDDEDVIETVWLCSGDSWASVHMATAVRQLGKRQLWDEVEAAYRWFLNQQKPGYSRFGVTVTPNEQRIWLDSPRQLVAKISQ